VLRWAIGFSCAALVAAFPVLAGMAEGSAWVAKLFFLAFLMGFAICALQYFEDDSTVSTPERPGP
jgi:uncharacterized membrane protein YtjA (UPF0391 family)